MTDLLCRKRSLVLCCGLLIYPLWVCPAWAGVAGFFLLETATLGPTGQSPVGGLNIWHQQFLGAKFEVTEPVRLESMGGHLVNAPLPGTFGPIFMALVPLNPMTDLPNDPELSDAFLVIPVDLPAASEEVTVDITGSGIEIDLVPGRYALIFGSGLFGVNGDGAMPGNDTDIGTPDDFTGFRLPNGTWVWQDDNDLLQNARLFVTGSDTVHTDGFEGYNDKKNVDQKS